MRNYFQGWFCSLFYQEVVEAATQTKLFFERVAEMKNLPEVQTLISLEIEVENSGRFSDKAGAPALVLAQKVETLIPTFIPGLPAKDVDQILSFRDRVRKGAQLVADRRMGIPLFLSFFGVSELTFSHVGD